MQPLSLEQYLLLGVISLIAVGLLTPVMRLVAKRYGVIDSPSESHKTHKNPVPYLGGVAIAIGVVGVTYVASLVSDFSRETFFLASTVLIPAIIMGIVGLVDDLKSLSPWPRFLIQSLFGIAISVLLVATNTLGSPFGDNWVDIPITTLFIVGITNSINFFDNIDGGASGALAIAALFLFILSLQGGQFLIAALSIVLAGATLGFLLWNKPPARIYMGDAGALFLGILIASLAIRFDPNPIDRIASFSIPLLLLAIPILDTSVAVASRIRRRISPFQGGRDHLSHRLMRMGFNKRQSVLILWIGSILFASFTLAISNASYSTERQVTIFAGVLWLILFIGFFRTADK
jgi:UDP-GlcNAc:undecaprenyl-phosphate/decaprenyl-phosphate GlcNAc-1-phosphate transferase